MNQVHKPRLLEWLLRCVPASADYHSDRAVKQPAVAGSSAIVLLYIRLKLDSKLEQVTAMRCVHSSVSAATVCLAQA